MKEILDKNELLKAELEATILSRNTIAELSSEKDEDVFNLKTEVSYACFEER